MILDLSDEARADIIDIHDYSVGQWGVARADSYLEDLTVQIERLVAGQYSGTKVDEVGRGLRRQVCGRHVIWFRVNADVLRVVRVLHQSRDAGRWVE